MFNIGDKVIITKRISNIKNITGVVIWINTKNEFYTVRHNYGRDGYKNNTCNIFYNHSSESIELDLEEIRNDKLKSLGI
jgi:hypothetical protein